MVKYCNIAKELAIMTDSLRGYAAYMTLEEIKTTNEMQIFDRKRVDISPKDLAATICAFANADGGTIAIGITDEKRLIQGVDYETEKLNEVLTAPISFCNPSVPVKTEMVACIDEQGRDNHLLLMYIDASPLLHANASDDVFLRVGDKNKKLSFEDRMSLMYSKGLRYYEDEPVAGAEMDDLDMAFVAEYVKRIKYSKSPKEYLLENKKFVTQKNGKTLISNAAILLFGKYPQQFFPRATIRFIRYDGTEALVGAEMNVIKDVIFDGRILDQVRNAVAYIKDQMKERTYLGQDGIFVTEEEYSEFVRTEIVVNAATHRDYGIRGTDIQIKMFDDRLEVDSPGKFPGMVRSENIRYTHFSRNPKIAAFLKDYGYVKEYGEGVDRMCREMEALGLPEPQFNNSTFILKTTVVSSSYEKLPIEGSKVADSLRKLPFEVAKVADSSQKLPIESTKVADSPQKLPFGVFESSYQAFDYNEPTIARLRLIYDGIDVNQIFGSAYIVKLLGCSDRTARNLMSKLKEMGVVEAVDGLGKGQYRFKYQSEHI